MATYGTGHYGEYVFGGPAGPNAPTLTPRNTQVPVSGQAVFDLTYSDIDNQPKAKHQLRYRPDAGEALYPAKVESYNPFVYERMDQGEAGIGGSPVPGCTGAVADWIMIPAFAMPQQVTMNIWFRCDPGELDNNVTYHSLWGYGGNNWDARFDNKRHVTFHSYADNSEWGSVAQLDHATDMDDGQWHMLTLVWDGVAGTTRTFLDAVFKNQTTFTAGQIPRQFTGDFAIGASSNGGRVWAGEYAEYSAIPAALTDAQILDLFQSVDDTGPAPWRLADEVETSDLVATLDTTGFQAVDYYVGARTADTSGDYSDWSADAIITVVPPTPGDVTAVSPGVTLLASTPGLSTSVEIISVPPLESFLMATPPKLVIEQYIEATPGIYTLNATAPAVGGQGMVHEHMDIPGPMLLMSGGEITLYTNTIYAKSAGVTLGMVEPVRTVYQRPPAPTYTIQEYRRKFTEGFTRVTRRVEILQADGDTLWDDTAGNRSRLISGNVSVDYDRDERRSADIELANFDKALVHKPEGFWYDKVLRLWRGIEFYDSSGRRAYEVPVGSFMIDRVSEARFPRTVKVTARDYTKKCLLSKFTQATGFTANQAIEDVIAAMAGAVGVSRRVFPTTGKTLGVDTFFERGKPRWEAMKEIATAHGYELFFDAYGYLVMRPFLDPTLSPVSHEFLTGPSVGNLVDWERSANDTRIFNHISVIGADNDTIPVWADAYNTNPLSPTNIDLLGDRVDTFESALVTTFAQAQELANTFLKVSALEEYEINLSSIVYPWLEAGEIVRFVDPERDNDDEPDRFLLTSFNIPMGLEPMSAVGRRVVIVS